MHKFWKGMFWMGLLVLIGINLAPYLMARKAAERVDVKIMGVFHPDGRPVEKSLSSYLGKLARGKLNKILGNKTAEKAESYQVRIELSNYNTNSLTLTDAFYELFSENVLLAKGQFKPKTPVTLIPDTPGYCYLPLTFQRPTEQVYEKLKAENRVQIRGRVGFLFRDTYRMELPFDMMLDLGSAAD